MKNSAIVKEIDTKSVLCKTNLTIECFILTVNSVRDSCTNKCQVSRCSACQYVRQRVQQPQRPSCVPCKTYYDRACWQRYYSCRYNYYRTTGYYYVS